MRPITLNEMDAKMATMDEPERSAFRNGVRWRESIACGIANDPAVLNAAPEPHHPDCANGCGGALMLAGPCQTQCAKTPEFQEQTQRDAEASSLRFLTQAGGNPLRAITNQQREAIVRRAIAERDSILACRFAQQCSEEGSCVNGCERRKEPGKWPD